MSWSGVSWWVVRVDPLAGSGNHNKHEQQSTLVPFGPFPRLELFGPHRLERGRTSPYDLESHVASDTASA